MKRRETGEPSGTSAHRAAAAELVAHCAVVTVSDSRTVETDESGPLARRLLEGAGHRIAHSGLIPNDERQVRELVKSLVERDDVDAIFLTGGTGLSARDRSVEAVQPLLDKEIPGFGELFRSLSFTDQVGSAAMLSRAVAGSAQGNLVVVLPGSKAAVELALVRLIIPELRHLLHEIRR